MRRWKEENKGPPKKDFLLRRPLDFRSILGLEIQSREEWSRSCNRAHSSVHSHSNTKAIESLYASIEKNPLNRAFNGCFFLVGKKILAWEGKAFFLESKVMHRV